MRNDIALFLDFRRKASQEDLCLVSSPFDVRPLFGFYFNQGDIFTSTDPKKIFDLVMFGRNHAMENGADFYDQRDAYGLLNRAVPTTELNNPRDFAMWDIDIPAPDDPKWITLGEWLEMEGYSVPALTREPKV